MSMIYNDVHKVKNIEDFGAPLSNLSKMLQALLLQIRTNVNEPDHPINLVVKKFQDIILWNVNERRNQMIVSTSPKMKKPNVEPEFDIVDCDNLSADSLSRDKSKILT